VFLLGAWRFLLSLNYDWFVCQLQRAEFLRKGSHEGPLFRMFPLLFQSIISNQMRPLKLRGAWFSRLLRHPRSLTAMWGTSLSCLGLGNWHSNLTQNMACLHTMIRGWCPSQSVVWGSRSPSWSLGILLWIIWRGTDDSSAEDLAACCRWRKTSWFYAYRRPSHGRGLRSLTRLDWRLIDLKMLSTVCNVGPCAVLLETRTVYGILMKGRATLCNVP